MKPRVFKLILATGALVLTLSACGGQSEPIDPLAAQREALQRAEELERVLREAGEQRQRQLEDEQI